MKIKSLIVLLLAVGCNTRSTIESQEDIAQILGYKISCIYAPRTVGGFICTDGPKVYYCPEHDSHPCFLWAGMTYVPPVESPDPKK